MREKLSILLISPFDKISERFDWIFAGTFLTPLGGLSTVRLVEVATNPIGSFTISEVSAGRRCTMTQRRMEASVLRGIKLGVVSGCVIGLLTGCSSWSRTTIVSGNDAPKVQVTQLEPERVVAEEVVVQPMQEGSPTVAAIDIPVEKPALRQKSASEIFATPKSTVIPAEISPRFESVTPVPSGAPIASSLPSGIESSMQRSSTGIPPISFEPEMPALPRGSYDGGSSAPQEAPIASVAKPAPIPSIPEPLTAQELMQVAKVVPLEPDQMEISTETLEEALNDIYFDYDQFAIREDAGSLLKANAQLLSAKFAEANIVIEGHCDERGTQSYNMVLGERRANAVKIFLEDLGISGDKLQVVSYGKEKPFCTEQTEVCWQENRRGHFVIK